MREILTDGEGARRIPETLDEILEVTEGATLRETLTDVEGTIRLPETLDEML